MKTNNLVALVITMSMIFLGACLNPEKETGSPSSSTDTSDSAIGPALTATLNAAEKIGLTSGFYSTPAGEERYPTDFSLVQISVSGTDITTQKILNSDVEVYSVGLISNSIFITGNFQSFAWQDGVHDCGLVTFSKRANQEKTRCLSQNQVGIFSPASLNRAAFNVKYGIKQRGSSIYFVTNNNLSTYSSYLYKWTDGDNEASLIFERPYAGSGFTDVFLDNNGSNICVLASGTGVFQGQMFCGTDDPSSWIEISSSLSKPILRDSFQLGSFIVSNNQRVSLSDLSISPRSANGSNGGLPSSNANQVNDLAGGMVLSAYAQSIGYISAVGDTSIISDYSTSNLYWYFIAKSGNYAWTTGGINFNQTNSATVLRRINLTNLNFDSNNYISQTGFSTISKLTSDFFGNIIVTGTTAGGGVGFAQIDRDGIITQLTVVPKSFSSVVEL